ncbi:TPM domain-containing protein [Sphingomonas sp. ASY06-1R]|uniref:TPM domain-containing protein n=1 Tax=Sphingomonas sp. ASY06-1R TaxID=3445771 RepID=UPI003FA2E82B
MRASLSRKGRGVVAYFSALLLCALASSLAHAQAFPKFTNFVVDQANVIPLAAERELNSKLADLQRRTRHQLAIATVSSLEDHTILDYSVSLARAWGVGRRGYNDGVLILVAPNEHEVRIEVGYGLEATLTDPRCSEIIRTAMVPRFTKGDLPGGIAAGADAIIARLRSAAPLEKPGA